MVAAFGDGVYRFAAAGKEITPALRFFKLPLEVGNTWTCNSVSENAPMQGTFVCKKDEVVQTPAGRFQTKVISCANFQAGTEKMAIECWYAGDDERPHLDPKEPNPVGMVKQRVRIGASEITLELKDYKIGPKWSDAQPR
jgi:hypothetical protein